jgi:subtilisin family serine protease
VKQSVAFERGTGLVSEKIFMKSTSRIPLLARSTPLRDRDPLAAVQFIDRIAICEPRLALSASAAADVFLEALSVHSQGFDVGSAPDPHAAAANIRARYSLEGAAFDGTGQSVAVIDSGIAWDHVAFANQKSDAQNFGQQRFAPAASGFGDGYRVVAGWDFAENDANPYDDGPAGYHGTHVAGTLAGHTSGFDGIAPGADLVALRVFDDFGNGSLDWIESALRWVIEHRNSLDNPITTVNLSLGAFATGAGQPLSQLDDELRTLRDDGVIVVAAAGNSFDRARPDSVAYPASHPLVAAVTAVDSAGTIESYAQRANGVFAAPGRGILSSVPDHVLGVDGNVNDFANADGTSMAAPQLAGASILVREAMQSLGLQPTVDDILSHLRDTSIHKTDATSGANYFMLDLESAIDSLLAGDRDSRSQGQNETNPLQWTGPSTLTVHGSSDADTIIVNLASPVTITINSIVHRIDRPLGTLFIEGGSGNDTLEIRGGVGDERLTARAALSDFDAASASLQSVAFLGDFRSFENVIFHGGGGNNSATFYDSAGDDTLEANPHTASFRGMTFTFVAIDVSSVYAYGTGGGSDTAFLYDSPENDRLAIRHQFTSLRSDDMFRLAFGFERVHAFAGAGGHDEANLYDSPGDDRLSASASTSWISGRDYYAGARGFATVRAESTLGGHDYASLYAVDTTALWTRSATLLQLNMQGGEVRAAQGFETTEAFIGTEKATVLPQSLRLAFYEQERRATRHVFDSMDDLPLSGNATLGASNIE